MEDLWRCTEAQQGHRRVFASGRGFWLGGHCQKGAWPSPRSWRLQVPSPWWAKQDPAVARAACSGSVLWVSFSQRRKFTLIFASISRVSQAIWVMANREVCPGLQRKFQRYPVCLLPHECSVVHLLPWVLLALFHVHPTNLLFFLVWSSSAFILVLSIQDIL